jgi:hypothetical protein
VVGAAIAFALLVGLVMNTTDPAPGDTTNDADAWAVVLLLATGVLVTVATVEFMIGAKSRKTGWYKNPARIHGMRYRDAGQWTKWAADGDRMVEDAASLPVIQHKRRSRWIIGAVLSIIASVLLVGCIALMNDAEVSGVSDVRTEMDTWKLPPTVKLSKRDDHVERGTFGATTPTVTRWFEPVGTTPAAAVLDLVSALREQGYRFTKYTDEYGSEWSTDCRYNSKYCSMDMSVDDRGRIEVYVSPGG